MRSPMQRALDYTEGFGSPLPLKLTETRYLEKLTPEYERHDMVIACEYGRFEGQPIREMSGCARCLGAPRSVAGGGVCPGAHSLGTRVSHTGGGRSGLLESMNNGEPLSSADFCPDLVRSTIEQL